MEVSDLMIGGYFRVAKDGVCIPKGTIVEIRGIDADNRLPEKSLRGSATCLSINDEDRMTCGVWAAYLEPIPLTKEILEKSGWIKDTFGYGRVCMKLNGEDELPKGISNALSFARWSIDENYQYHFLELYMWVGNIMQHDVHYVHQLQYAFHIFGIKIRITL